MYTDKNYSEGGLGTSKSNSDIQSLRPSGFTPAFGRVVIASRWFFFWHA